MPVHHVMGNDEASRRDAAKDPRQPGPGSRRHGPERRTDFGNGHRALSAAQRTSDGPGARKRCKFWTRSSTRFATATSAESAKLTTRNFEGPLQTIIPWATNRFTDVLIEKCREHYGDKFWGFWMLGGMAGGGMGFIFDPDGQSRRPAVARQDDGRDQSARCRRRCRSPWTRSSTISRSTTTARPAELIVGEPRQCPIAITHWCCPICCGHRCVIYRWAARLELERIGAPLSRQRRRDSRSVTLDSVLPRSAPPGREGRIAATDPAPSADSIVSNTKQIRADLAERSNRFVPEPIVLQHDHQRRRRCGM